MYDKRYTPAQIKTERWWAGFNMFVVMALLCWGVGKVAYHSGYDDGYHAGRFLTPAAQQSSYHAMQTSSIEIEILSEPQDKTWFQSRFDMLLEYWGWGALGVVVCVVLNFLVPLKPDKDRDIL